MDTAGLFFPASENDPRFESCYYYAPTSRCVFLYLLWQIQVNFRNFAFVDFGCGKGKTLLLAAELGFREIIGVEISRELIAIANDNVKVYLNRTGRDTRCQLVCTDARDYRMLPCGPAVFYFHNPFGEEVIREVLKNIERSLAAAPREAYIVYLNPQHRGPLDESAFLSPMKVTAWYSIHKASGSLATARNK